MKILLKVIAMVVISIIIYTVAFGFIFKKPLTIGYCKDAYNKKKDYLLKCNGSKFVIIAGSNGLFSHSAKVIEKEIGINGINYSLDAGLGIDLILEKGKEVLKQGDIVILPLEYGFYNQGENDVTFTANGNSFIFQYDTSYLFKFGPQKFMASIFSFDLKYLISAIIESGFSATCQVSSACEGAICNLPSWVRL